MKLRFGAGPKCMALLSCDERLLAPWPFINGHLLLALVVDKRQGFCIPLTVLLPAAKRLSKTRLSCMSLLKSWCGSSFVHTVWGNRIDSLYSDENNVWPICCKTVASMLLLLPCSVRSVVCTYLYIPALAAWHRTDHMPAYCFGKRWRNRMLRSVLIA